MAHQALARGAAAYVQKGTRPDDVVATLDDVLGRPAESNAATTAPPDNSASDNEEIEQLRSAFRDGGPRVCGLLRRS